MTGMGFAFRRAVQFTAGVIMRRRIAVLGLTLFAVACSVSRQQEIQMGADYARQINAQIPLVRDPEVNRYINVLGDELARVTGVTDLPWNFYVVDSREVNAFAVPGGYVYVNRGLVERTDRLDELAGVLAHEIGHVVKRHSVEQLEKAQRAEFGVTLACILTGVCGGQLAQTAINVAGTAVFARFSRQDEHEADQVGFDILVRAGISPEGMATMFQKLLQERRNRPSGVAAWFATHPLEEDRLQAVQARIARIPAAQRQRLTRNTSNFAGFKQRLRSLPYTGR
jgi:predicted Zn-dependent protease